MPSAGACRRRALRSVGSTAGGWSGIYRWRGGREAHDDYETLRKAVALLRGYGYLLPAPRPAVHGRVPVRWRINPGAFRVPTPKVPDTEEEPLQ